MMHSSNATLKPIRQQFADTMLSIGKADEDLVVVVGDISHGILQPFAESCPGRYFNAGILEPTLMSMTAGLASVGLFPVLHTIAPFLIERAFEQIKLDYVYHDLPGNIVSVGSVFDYSNLGCTHHCYGDFALLKTLPGVQIVYPGSAVEFDVLFRQTYSNKKLTYFRIPEHPHSMVFQPGEIELGRAVFLAEGGDLTVIAIGPQLMTAMGVRESLIERGVQAEVLYFPTIRPLDTESIVESASKTGKVIVIEEHMRSGGFGDDVLRVAHGIDGLQFLSCAIPDIFIRGYGSYYDHCETVGLTVDGVLQKIRDAGWIDN
jgi:transketolase